MRYRINLLFVLVLVAFFTSCQSKQAKEEVDEQVSSKMVELTKDQFEMAKMVVGEPLEHTFIEVVNSKGYLKPAPDGLSQVVVPIPGEVKRIVHKTGQWVNSGDALFAMKGDKIIEVQQEYLQTKAKLIVAQAEMNRLKKLTEANVTANKDYQMALGDYQVMKATNDALLAKFELLNIDPEKLENGQLVPEIVIEAPISGYISKLAISMGEYLEPQKMAVEIINTHKLQLNFYVFENTLSVLKRGQKVEFYEPDRKDEIYTGKVEVIGKSIDEATKTIPCLATIDNIEKLNLVNGMYAECNVVVSEHLAYAVPTEAIVKDGYNNFVLVKSGGEDDVHKFRKVQVEIGREELEFTEILTTGLSNILLKGLYNLNL